jgi:hypothetical protein
MPLSVVASKQISVQDLSTSAEASGQAHGAARCILDEDKRRAAN